MNRTGTGQPTSIKGQQALRDTAKKRPHQVYEEQQSGESVTGVLLIEFVMQR
ncbi:flagellar basal body-associated FliL family protein [Marinobacter sp. chi1]|uniref:Flagellar basal body-associated FliL family protein n=1 Tax=Marinobacter suaedae TaxID=3057675 RepID=A0ABT8W0B8_9GAMM|nr:flagellar basal body-associated FliL family protein [Marinobacter sp. chi1]MDO3721689.1 flagellar basal body-associated FliL family protein [Marinobacter sp. chi1]